MGRNSPRGARAPISCPMRGVPPASVSRAWEALPAGSPYRDVVEDAVVLVHDVAGRAWELEPAVARDLEEEHADLVLLGARHQVMNIVTAAIAEAGVRNFAKQTGISVGHVSDLSNGRGGLPQPRTARAIDDVAGTEIAEIVEGARADATKIRRAARDRERQATNTRGSRATSTANALTRISLALAEDPELLTLADLLIRLPRPARRGLIELLSSLRGSG